MAMQENMYIVSHGDSHYGFRYSKEAIQFIRYLRRARRLVTMETTDGAKYVVGTYPNKKIIELTVEQVPAYTSFLEYYKDFPDKV